MQEDTRMKNKSFVVFLDVDGVLNSRTTVQRTPDGYQGTRSVQRDSGAGQSGLYDGIVFRGAD